MGTVDTVGKAVDVPFAGTRLEADAPVAVGRAQVHLKGRGRPITTTFGGHFRASQLSPCVEIRFLPRGRRRVGSGDALVYLRHRSEVVDECAIAVNLILEEIDGHLRPVTEVLEVSCRQTGLYE